jgi:hypothetical protein
VIKKSLFVLNFALLSGCNTVFFGSYGDDNQSLRDFAESVFVLQNSMTNAVMFSDVESTPEIAEAEKKMHVHCEALNKAGSLQFDGLSVDFALAQRIQQTAVSCEKAAKQLQSLLINRIDKTI